MSICDSEENRKKLAWLVPGYILLAWFFCVLFQPLGVANQNSMAANHLHQHHHQRVLSGPGEVAGLDDADGGGHPYYSTRLRSTLGSLSSAPHRYQVIYLGADGGDGSPSPSSQLCRNKTVTLEAGPGSAVIIRLSRGPYLYEPFNCSLQVRAGFGLDGVTAVIEEMDLREHSDDVRQPGGHWGSSVCLDYVEVWTKMSKVRNKLCGGWSLRGSPDERLSPHGPHQTLVGYCYDDRSGHSCESSTIFIRVAIDADPVLSGRYADKVTDPTRERGGFSIVVTGYRHPMVAPRALPKRPQTGEGSGNGGGPQGQPVHGEGTEQTFGFHLLKLLTSGKLPRLDSLGHHEDKRSSTTEDTLTATSVTSTTTTTTATTGIVEEEEPGDEWTRPYKTAEVISHHGLGAVVGNPESVNLATNLGQDNNLQAEGGRQGKHVNNDHDEDDDLDDDHLDEGDEGPAESSETWTDATKCGEDEFTCKVSDFSIHSSRPHCIWKRLRCDGHQNCGFTHNTDELDCHLDGEGHGGVDASSPGLWGGSGRPTGSIGGGASLAGSNAFFGAAHHNHLSPWSVSTMSLVILVYLAIVLILVLVTMLLLRWHRTLRSPIDVLGSTPATAVADAAGCQPPHYFAATHQAAAGIVGGEDVLDLRTFPHFQASGPGHRPHHHHHEYQQYGLGLQENVTLGNPDLGPMVPAASGSGPSAAARVAFVAQTDLLESSATTAGDAELNACGVGGGGGHCLRPGPGASGGGTVSIMVMYRPQPPDPKADDDDDGGGRASELPPSYESLFTTGGPRTEAGRSGEVAQSGDDLPSYHGVVVDRRPSPALPEAPSEASAVAPLLLLRQHDVVDQGLLGTPRQSLQPDWPLYGNDQTDGSETPSDSCLLGARIGGAGGAAAPSAATASRVNLQSRRRLPSTPWATRPEIDGASSTSLVSEMGGHCQCDCDHTSCRNAAFDC